MIRYKNIFIKQNTWVVARLPYFVFLLSCLLSNKTIIAQYQLSERLSFSDFLFRQKKYSLYISEIHDIGITFSPTLLPSKYGFYLAFSYYKTNRYDSLFRFGNKDIFYTDNQNNNKIFAIKKAALFTDKKISEQWTITEKSKKSTANEFLQFLTFADSLQNYKTITQSIIFKNNKLQASSKRLLCASAKYNAYKPKSPAIAGFLSALIPGTGKIYAGRPKECIVPLGETLAFSFVAFEGYRKDGFHSPQLYIFGGLCALFYAANIFGSVKAVKINNSQNNEEFNKTIKGEVDRNIDYLLEQ